MKTDIQLQQDVIAELKWEPSVDAAQIGVEVKGGVVTLTGHVNSYPEKWNAERAAQRVSGVKALAVEMDVTSPSTIIDGPIEAALPEVRRKLSIDGLRRRSSTAPLKRAAAFAAGSRYDRESPSTIIDGPIEASREFACTICCANVSVDDHRRPH